MKKDLKFNEDGTFKIVQFTDVHWVDGSQKDLQTRHVMEIVLDYEKPDIVVFTGDTVYTEKNMDFVKDALDTVSKAGVPWASVFGNHDTQMGSGKDELLKVIQEVDGCLTEAGDKNVSGVGNYTLCINGHDQSKPLWMLYFLDSGNLNSNNKVKGYDYIKRDQIQWYIDKSTDMKSKYRELPGLMFFHMPLPEYNEVWNYNICYGEKNEKVCCPKQNSGLFSAMLETGNVKGVFVGHDHINDYFGDLCGIKLYYGRATGYNTYGKEGFIRGARVILLKENEAEFETWVRLEDGTKVSSQKLHEPLYDSI
jgi:Predicted phosphohydrolases